MRKLDPVIIMETSIWQQTCTLPSYPPHSGNVKTDVLIIGGGMAGLLCAYQLRQSGVDCLVIEAERIGAGVTGNTTAKITSQHGLAYQELLREFGADTARAYYLANQEALEEYGRLAGQIPCDFEIKDNYIYSVDAQIKLEEELEALSRLGIPGEYIPDLPLPISTSGAVCFREQAQFHPLKFLKGIAEGQQIRELTRAVKIDRGYVLTNRGRIQAEKVIVATHFPVWNRRGLYFLKQYQSRAYALALEGAGSLKGMYLDSDSNGFSFRSHGDTLILGSGGHRTGKQSKGWEPLSALVQAHYPGGREVARWATQDCMTLDGMPYIGQYSPHTPWLYVATGFNKWGMTGSMVSAMLLRDLILGRENPYSHVFDPSRSMLHPQLAVNGWESALHLLKPTGPRCPHLGCALEWNPWEHSWDCPCHGSRFSETGELLENPAKRDLNRK